jgi:stearoyl-CoA desaturase (delta-9 desaturase)
MWGGFIRIALFQQIASAVNSICHYFGTRPYRTSDGSRNNVLVAIAAAGEGWHNNHHAFPTSAFLGLRWWQIDMGNMLIHVLSACGLVWNVRRPGADDLAKRFQRGTPATATVDVSSAGVNDAAKA